MTSSASANMFLIIFAINIFASTLLALQSEAAATGGSDAAAQAPTTGSDVVEPLSLDDPRSASPQLREFIETCRRRVNVTCVREVVDHLHNNKGMITKTCCHMLMSTGPDCYKVMHGADERRFFFPISARRTSFLARRRENLWNRCQKMNLTVVPGDFPIVPAKELLPFGDHSFAEMCARKVTPQCGYRIAMILTGKSTKRLDEDCCGKLVVRMGQSCHREMVRVLVDDVQGQMKALVASNSILIWEHCQRLIFG